MRRSLNIREVETCRHAKTYQGIQSEISKVQAYRFHVAYATWNLYASER